jgi:hypothetical protein
MNIFGRPEEHEQEILLQSLVEQNVVLTLAIGLRVRGRLAEVQTYNSSFCRFGSKVCSIKHTQPAVQFDLFTY